MKQAFSYIRFSSPEQAKGDSFRRQSEKAAEWAKLNGYTIVKAWSDPGVSAYRGKNAESGDFAEFLKAAEAGRLPIDSVLIVENLDRVSRQAPRLALTKFLQVINAGVGIVTLTDNMLHTKESLDGDPSGMGLLVTLLVMVRANGESRLKGERVAAAWSRKRANAREKAIPLTDRIPSWLISKRDAAGCRTFRKDPKRVKIVRRIFDETAQGFGRRMIVKGLNREGKNAFLSKSGWQTSTVAKIIRSRTVLGEYQPHRRNAAGKNVPDGEAILKYYPVVIDQDLWDRANAAINLRRTNAGGRHQAEAANLIPGLGWCICTQRMTFLNKGKPPRGGRYYACSAALLQNNCSNTRLWRARDVERYLIHQIDPGRLDEAIEPMVPEGPSPQDFAAEIAELEAMRQAAIQAIMRNPDNSLGAEMDRKAIELAEQIEDVCRRRDAAAAERQATPALPKVRTAVEDVAKLAEELKSASVEARLALRIRITHQIRTVFTAIEFGPHTIAGLIALPGAPKSRRGFFGLPKPIVHRTFKKDDIQRYFWRHEFFTDEAEVLDDLGGGKGLVKARYEGNA